MVEPKDLLTADIIDRELSTKEKRQQISMELKALEANKGWIFIERVLKVHIDILAEQILNDPDLAPEVEKELKRDRAFLMLFKTIPGEWVKELFPVQQTQPGVDDDDPYAA